MVERKSEPVEAEIVGEEKSKTHMNLNIGNLFFGLLLVLVGGLALASNFGWLTIEWANLWQLWPMIIVLIGFSLISVRNFVWKIVSVIVGIGVLALVAWVMLSKDMPGLNQNLISEEVVIQKTSQTVKKSDIDIKSGASSINVSSSTQDSVAKVNLKSNSFRISKASTVSGDTQNVTLTTETRSGQNWWLFGNIKNSWEVYLNRELPLNLSLDIGASSLSADLSNTHLTDLNIKTGASSISVRVGDLEKLVTINIEAGVSSVSLNVPTDSGVKLVLQSGLTGKNIDGLEKVGDDKYETANYSTAVNKIDISGKLGVSSFSINRY